MQPEKLRKLVRKWTLPVIALTVLGGIVALLVSRTLTPIYEAKAVVLVVAGPRQTTDPSVALNASQVTSTAAALLTQQPLLEKVIAELKLRDTPDQLAKRITVTPGRDTELVDVVVRDPDPQQAALIANTLVTDYVGQVTAQNNRRIDQAGAALQAQITDLQKTLSQEQQDLANAVRSREDATALRAAVDANTALLTQLNLNYSTFKATQAQNLETASIAAAASPPSQPASPRILLNTMLGTLAGLLLGLGLASLMEYLDRGLNTADDVRQRLAVPCLGVVPVYNAGGRGKSAKNKQRGEAATEAYRRLRTNLLFANPDKELRTVVVTSVRAGEGKTRTAANLAVALANSDKRVLLMDCDLRRPSQHKLFKKSLVNGVSDMIMATTPAHIPALNGDLRTQYENLSLLTCGTIPPNPSELLASKRSRLLMGSLQKGQDIVVVDTPPADAVTDALSLAAEATATVLVVEAGKTNAAQAAAVIASLRGVGADVVGVVLNKARDRSTAGYYYQYGYAATDRPSRTPDSPEPKESWAPVAEGGPVKVG